VCACSISRCSSGNSGNADCRRQRDNSDFLPAAALRLPQTQSLCLNSNSNTTVTRRTAALLPRGNSIPPSTTMTPPPATAAAPVPRPPRSTSCAHRWVAHTALVLVKDEPRPRLRGAGKCGHRCRVSTLRIQARGQVHPIYLLRSSMPTCKRN
jgi:hypothetical protein